jgi:hypothetical protein
MDRLPRFGGERTRAHTVQSQWWEQWENVAQCETTSMRTEGIGCGLAIPLRHDLPLRRSCWIWCKGFERRFTYGGPDALHWNGVFERFVHDGTLFAPRSDTPMLLRGVRSQLWSQLRHCSSILIQVLGVGALLCWVEIWEEWRWTPRATTREKDICVPPLTTVTEKKRLYHINRRDTGPSGYLSHWICMHIYEFPTTVAHFSTVLC